LPIIAPFAVGQGATLAAAGVIAAMLPLGQILAGLPAGALAARIGDRPAMILAGSLSGLGFLGAALAPSLINLGAAVLLVGGATAVFHLARHSYLTEITPPLKRARVLSTLGGVHRIGQFAGPFLGAGVIHFSDMRAAFILAVVTAAAAAVTVWLARPRPTGPRPADPAEPEAASQRPEFRQVLCAHRRMLATMGAVG